MIWSRRGRTAVAIVAVTASAFALSGCSGSGGGGAQEGKDDGVVHWLTARNANDPTMAAVKAIADEYSAEHPEFTLDLETVPDRPSFDQKVRLLASSDELPDMFDADPEPFFKQIADSDMVVDIQELYDELGVTDDFFPISLEYPKWDDGSLDLITLNANVEYFWYNTDLFEQAGVTPPTTLDELVETCGTLKAAGITPITVNGKDLWPLYRYMAMPTFRQTGNEYLDQLKVGEESMGGETGLAAAEFLESLSGCFQEGFSTTDYTTAVNLFTSGDAAMLYMGTWELPSFLDEEKNLKPNISYFTMPTEGADDATPPTDYFANSGIGTAILKDSLTPELKDFLKYFFANYGDTAFKEYNVIPSIKPTIDDSVTQVYQDVLEDIAGVETFAKVWDVQLDPNTNSVLGREGTNLILGQTTPQAFAESVDASVQQFLQSQ
jgi:raffinose/stachyose/melibiose transport system substrate-binding protein